MLKILWTEKRLNNREVFFLIDALQQPNSDFPSLEKHLLFSDLFQRHGRRQRCFRRTSCLGVKAHNLFGTGNDVSHRGLSRKETCWKITPKLILRAQWNSCKVIQEVCFSQLAPGYGPTLQGSALLCAYLLACSVCRVVLRREKCLRQHQKRCHAKGPRKRENKEGGKRAWDSVLKRNRGADTSDHSFSQTSYSDQPPFSDSPF